MQTKVKEQKKIDAKELVLEAPHILASLFAAIDWLAKNDVEDNPAAAHVRASIHALLSAHVRPSDETLDISFFATYDKENYEDEGEDEEFISELKRRAAYYALPENRAKLKSNEEVKKEMREYVDNLLHRAKTGS